MLYQLSGSVVIQPWTRSQGSCADSERRHRAPPATKMQGGPKQFVDDSFEGPAGPSHLGLQGSGHVVV